MTNYTIEYTEETLPRITEAIESFGDKVSIRRKGRIRITFAADEATAQALSQKTGIAVEKSGSASFDMGMQDTMMRTMQELAKSLKNADAAIALAKAKPVDPVDGQPAERYMARTEDFMKVTSGYQLKAVLEKTGLRIHSTGIDTLSVIFFDAADPVKVQAVAMPDGWTVQKLGAPSP